MKPWVRQRKLRREALVLIPLAALAVKLLPASYILAHAARPPARIKRFADPDLPAQVAAAVVARAAWFRLEAPCLPTALVARWMLGRRGVASKLCLGVRRGTAGLAAHAWLEIDQKIVFGATEAAYAPVAKYGT
jgi:Transglutaminase-like superfamily